MEKLKAEIFDLLRIQENYRIQINKINKEIQKKLIELQEIENEKAV